MKKFFLLLITVLCIIIFSCKNTPNVMSLKLDVLLNGKNINTNGYYNLDLDKDNYSDTDNIEFVAHLYNTENVEIDTAVFNFECNNLDFDIKDRNTANISLKKIKAKGVHSFKVQCLNYDSLEATFLIETISSFNKYNIKYDLNNEYKNKGYSISSDMISGVISEYNNTLNLASGCVYTFTIEKEINDKYNTEELLASTSDNNIAYIRNKQSDLFELVCIGKNNTSCNITVFFNKSNIKRVFKIKLLDTSVAYIEELENKSDDIDTIISLSAFDKQKNYKINLSTPYSDDTLLFSVDAELINQNSYYDGSIKKYVPEINPDALWYEESLISFDTWYEGEISEISKKNDVKWSVEFNGITKEFTIFPKKETTFTYKKTAEKNLHTYLYVKFKDDLTYRWKYRVMIGGVIEGIFLTDGNMNISSDFQGDEIKNKTIIVDKVKNWILKANYIPITTRENETWLYLSGIKEWTDCYDDKGDFIKKIPKVLNPYDERQSSFSSIYSSSYTYSEKWSGYYTSSGEKIFLYNTACCERNDEIGRHSFPLRWGTSNLDVRFVAINLDTLFYDYIDFYSSSSDEAILKSTVQGHRDLTNKSYYLLETPTSNITVWDGDKNSATRETSIVKETAYSSLRETKHEQLFPYTVSNENKNYRKFFSYLNSTSYFTLQTNYDLKNVELNLSSDAQKYFSLSKVIIDPITKQSAEIVITTKWREIVENDKNEYIYFLNYKDYLTDIKGSYIDLIITDYNDNKKYSRLQIVVYC